MRFTAVLLLAGAASASLLARDSVPTCAITCIAEADLGDCSSTDNTCLCNNSAFISSVTSCVQSTCSSSDLAAAEEFAQEDCLAVGVTLTASSAASTGTSSGSSSGSAASGSSTATSAGSASSSAATTSSSSGAKPTGVPVFAAAALGLAAFAL